MKLPSRGLGQQNAKIARPPWPGAPFRIFRAVGYFCSAYTGEYPIPLWQAFPTKSATRGCDSEKLAGKDRESVGGKNRDTLQRSAVNRRRARHSEISMPAPRVSPVTPPMRRPRGLQLARHKDCGRLDGC